MAFTEVQKLKIGRILGMTNIQLQAWLDFNSTNITTQVETDVATELTRWTTAGVKFVSVEPRESNRGGRISPGAEKNDIRKNIAINLGLNDLAMSLASGQISLMRG